MFCMNCGKEINGDVAYCPHCGKATKESPLEAGRAKEESKEYAISSMVIGLMSLILPFLNLPCAILAIVLSKKGKGSYAQAGSVIGIIGLILAILSYVFFIVFIVLIIVGQISIGVNPQPTPSISGSTVTIM